ncbi:unnamed protein product [Arctia plantaginis]|uniref:N-acetyltransferase domain-containing protein n=1 Tax=Arctia plantaginis TaxID=874455 RepID=A0A8S1B7E9_ARCPL|nr:unnamed protein product [Arctia plantaginis]
MECEIVIREAKPEDTAARAQLIERGISSYDRDAFCFFILQELMLQVSVLAAAVLFIFGGLSPAACALVPLALVAIVALIVYATHRIMAKTAAARLRSELAGFVAELHGPPGAERHATAARVLHAREGRGGEVGAGFGRLVGTVSVSEHNGAHRCGWLHGLAVDARWRRRGVGGALLDAARGGAAGAGLRSLELATSALQARATALLHASGWQVRTAYHRRLAGEALTLPMLLMRLDLDSPRAHT